MAYNVAVLVYSKDELERLHAYVVDESNGVKIRRYYQRTDWHNINKPVPIEGYVVQAKDKKSEFQLRMKFDTVPRTGMEL